MPSLLYSGREFTHYLDILGPKSSAQSQTSDMLPINNFQKGEGDDGACSENPRILRYENS